MGWRVIVYATKGLKINSKLSATANLPKIIYAIQGEKENADEYFHLIISIGIDIDDLGLVKEYYVLVKEETDNEE